MGQRGQTYAGSLAAKTQIVEAEQQLARVDSKRVETAVAELNELQTKLSDTEEQLRSATDVLARTTVRAPVDGIVVTMSVNSPGRVVSPGETLLELLPTGADPVVEARLRPRDIDAVSLGQDAQLRLTAFNARTTPVASGNVTYLSTDRLVDPHNEQPYYIARLSMNGKLPAGFEREQITPGMPVDVYISTGRRTFVEYLLKPIEDSFGRAFREE